MSFVTDWFRSRKVDLLVTVDRFAAKIKLIEGVLAPVSSIVMASKAANKLIKLGWIGAGGINFGSLEGPWNHAVRMQKQNNVQFTAVVDPNVKAAQVLPKVVLVT